MQSGRMHNPRSKAAFAVAVLLAFVVGLGALARLSPAFDGPPGARIYAQGQFWIALPLAFRDATASFRDAILQHAQDNADPGRSPIGKPCARRRPLSDRNRIAVAPHLEQDTARLVRPDQPHRRLEPRGM